MKRIIILLLSFCWLSACDISKDHFLLINKKPQLTIVSGKDTLSQFVDSIKRGNSIKLNYSITDEEELTLMHTLDTTLASILIKENNITIKANYAGVLKGTLYCSDSFRTLTEFNVQATIFSNLSPICSLSVSSSGDYTVIIDLSKSYDRDASHGGRIVSYEYNIAGYKFTSSSSRVNHTFGTPGIKTISARVMDNDNSWSSWQTTTMDIK